MGDILIEGSICDIQEKFRGPIWEYEKLYVLQLLSFSRLLRVCIQHLHQDELRKDVLILDIYD